eukprot:jgi/Galph1/1136/GphlegSOOS_G5741.1
MHPQATVLLNQIASCTSANEKVELLKSLQELVLYKEPNSLEQVFPLVVEYQRDRIVSVRQSIVEFLTTVCKEREEYLYSVMNSFLLMITDESVTVQRKVVYNVNNLLPVFFNAFCRLYGDENRQRMLLNGLIEIGKTTSRFIFERNEGLALQSLKLVESVIKLFSPSQSIETSESLYDWLQTKKQEQLVEELSKVGEQLLQSLLNVFSVGVDDVNFQVKCATLTSLFHLMQERPSLASSIMNVILQLTISEQVALSNAQKVTIRTTLKNHLLSVISVATFKQSPNILQSIEAGLLNMGVDEETIKRTKDSATTSQWRRPPKRPYSSTMRTEEANQEAQENKKSRSSSLVPSLSTIEARNIVDTLIGSQPLTVLVELVLNNLLGTPATFDGTNNSSVPSVSHDVAMGRGDIYNDNMTKVKNVQVTEPENNLKQPTVTTGTANTVSKLTRDPRLDPRLASKLARAASSAPSQIKSESTTKPSEDEPLFSTEKSELDAEKVEDEQIVPLSISTTLQKPPSISLPNYTNEMLDRLAQDACKRILLAEMEAAMGGGSALRLALLGRLLPNCKENQPVYKESIAFIVEKMEERLELAIHWLHGEAALCTATVVREEYQKNVFDLMKKDLTKEDKSEENELSKWTVKQLQERLTHMNVEFNKNARKSELIELIRKNEQVMNSKIEGETDGIERNRSGSCYTVEIYEDTPSELEKHLSERYKSLFYTFAREASRKLGQSEDSTFAKLYVQVPIIFQGAVDEVRTLVKDPSKTTAVLNALLETITERPGRDRFRFLKVVLDYAIHEDEVLRGPAIRLVSSRLYSMDSLSEAIESFAEQKLFYALEQVKEKQSTVSQATKASTRPLEESDGEVENQGDLWLQSMIGRYCGLYMVLSARKPSLLIDLLKALEQVNDQTMEIFQTYIPNLARVIDENSPALYDLVANHSPKATVFVLDLLDHLVDYGKKASPELVMAACKHFEDPRQSDSDIRYVIPFIDTFSKDDIVRLLPQLATLEATNLKKAISKIFSARSPVLQAAEFLVELHVIDPKEGIASLRNLINAIQCCFELKSIFTQDAVATALQQLVEKSPIPILLLRTVIQSLLQFPHLQNFIISVIFARLIDREVWEESHLWEGFIKACQMTVPRSVPVILRLPPQPLKDILSRSVTIQQAVKKYGQRMKDSIPSSLWSILENST